MLEDMVLLESKNPPLRVIAYKDDVQQLVLEYDLVSWQSVPILKASAEDMVECFGDEFENQNYHSMTGLPEAFLSELWDEMPELDTQQLSRIFKAFSIAVEKKLF